MRIIKTINELRVKFLDNISMCFGFRLLENTGKDLQNCVFLRDVEESPDVKRNEVAYKKVRFRKWFQILRPTDFDKFHKANFVFLFRNSGKDVNLKRN